MRPRDPWRRKLDAQIERRRRQKGDGFGRDVVQIRAARQEVHDLDSLVALRIEGTSPPKAARSRARTPVYGFVMLACLAAFAAPIVVHEAGVLDLRLPSWTSSPISAATAAGTPVPTAAPRTVARVIPICSGSRRITCVVDGDTGWHEGTKWRLVTRDGGVDAPEISKPECAAEKAMGDRATRRLQSLMSGGYTMSGSGYDRDDRRLVTITLADGRDAGDVLLDEGLAQEWPNSGNVWCD